MRDSWLSRFLEDVHVVAPVAGRPLRMERLPDGRTVLIVRGLESQPGDVSVAGPRTRALFKQATGLTRAVILRFKPGWALSLLGVPASALTDRYVKLDDLWGAAGRDLSFDLLAARNVPEVLELLSNAITARPHHAVEPGSARLARRAIRLLEADEPRVENVATQLGVTARHLRRAFADNIGIGPKEFVRFVRLQRAVRNAAASSDWGRIAADAGYYDQAHLIADFRDLVGLTPGAFLKRAAD